MIDINDHDHPEEEILFKLSLVGLQEKWVSVKSGERQLQPQRNALNSGNWNAEKKMVERGRKERQ